MPWRCGACGVEVADDGCAACPSCAAVKGAWTLFAAQTRRFVVGTKKVVVLRGDDPTPRAADDPARAADAPVAATRAVSLPKPVARDLAARGLLPASRDLLLVRVTARGAAARTVTLVADFAARESEEHALEPHAEVDGEGVVDVPIVLVHGEGDLAGIDFPGLHVVDVTEDAGHAVRVEVSALRRPPVRLPLGGHWAAVRLLEPDGRPAAGVAVSLVLADGSRRPATTDDDGNARWEDVPAGAVALELDDPATFPDVVDDDAPAPVDDAPPAPPDDAPAPVDDPDADLADYDAHPLQRPWGGARWAAVRLVEPDGRPAADAAVALVLDDGTRREARTDADGVARWDDLPDGAASLELLDPAFVPEAQGEAPAEASPPPPRGEPDQAPGAAEAPDLDAPEPADLKRPRLEASA